MNYKLALKLKEAGFPQNKTKWILYTVSCPSAKISNQDHFALRDEDLGSLPVMEVFSAPTLEELIEACGYGFCSLQIIDRSDNRRWVCINKDFADDNGEGKTPLEAVANLFLILNE